MALNNQLLFHVYEKDNKVVAHTLTAEELENALVNNIINPSEHEIVALAPNENESKDASY